MRHFSNKQAQEDRHRQKHCLISPFGEGQQQTPPIHEKLFVLEKNNYRKFSPPDSCEYLADVCLANKNQRGLGLCKDEIAFVNSE